MEAVFAQRSTDFVDFKSDLRGLPPSPCATSTTTTTSTASRSFDFSNCVDSTTSSPTCTVQEPTEQRQTWNSSSIKFPSPSRSTLDPEYAKRLYTSSKINLRNNDAFDKKILTFPVVHRREHSERMQEGIFPSLEVCSMDTDTAENVTNINTPSSHCTEFFTPERAGASRCQMKANSSTMAGPKLKSKNHSPRNSPLTYYTPLSSPNKKTAPARGVIGPDLTSPANQRLGSSRFTKRKTTDYYYSDRFIPSRKSSNLNFSVWNSNGRSETFDNQGEYDQSSLLGSSATVDGVVEGVSGSGRSEGQSQQTPLLNTLLRSELLGENINPTPASPTTHRNNEFGQTLPSPTNKTPLREGRNFLRFNQNPRSTALKEVHGAVDPTSAVNSFSLSPVRVSPCSRLSSMPIKRKRRIAKSPFKILDAPALADDFYLNLVDWSSLDVLAVGLGSCVYLWSACTSKVTMLCDFGALAHNFGNQMQDVAVTSVSWTQRGIYLAVGLYNGEVQIWDTVKCRRVRTFTGHTARIGAMSWSGSTIASGSRDKMIYFRDVRAQEPLTSRLAAHKQEVCGLKWSHDEPAQLASGGNDNKLLVWDIKNQSQPIYKFAEHTAAVKAIAWSPHQHGLLASGGGTADRSIRFWNTLSGSSLNSVDTGSQVCNLAWSQNCNEIVSTHGYSLNQVAIWKYPTMDKVATLTGHTSRVIYLAMSPDGSSIVTGAGDETLRFWQVFPGPRSHNKSSNNGLLFPCSPGSILR